MTQLEHIEAIEKRFWSAADTLRANSNYASNEYFLPVMGLVFLRHAYSRFLGVKDAIEAGLPTRGVKTRPLTKEDFSQKSAIFLQPKAQFDTLVALPDRAKAIIDAMESIEADYENLRGVQPKSEYQELDNAVLGQLLRTLNPEELKRVSGDVFGRIYEYFLTQFADQKAHDGGEFFTPVSLVSLIANIIEKNGVIWLKAGADKRRVNFKEELRRLFQFTNQFHADELPTKAGIDKLDKLRFRDFLRDVYKQEDPDSPAELPPAVAEHEPIHRRRQAESGRGAALC